ncbi:MAG: YihY/virulence factor BrkB family protein [bacterium]
MTRYFFKKFSDYFKYTFVVLKNWRKLLGFIFRVTRHFFYSFLKKGLLLKAAALSYTAVLCILPLLAMTFAGSTFFIERMEPEQVNEMIDKTIVRLVPQVKLLEETAGAAEVHQNSENGPSIPTREQLREQVKEMMNQLGSGEVGIIGITFFVFLAIILLVSMENIFNDIWKVKKGRSMFRKFAIYKTVISTGSFLLLLIIFAANRWQSITMFQRLPHLPRFDGFLQIFSPFVLVWMALTVVYMAMPHKKVKFIPAATGAFLATILLQINNFLNTYYVFNVARVRHFYGGLGILPIFLLSLYLSWLLILVGAQLTHSIETIDKETKKFTPI